MTDEHEKQAREVFDGAYGANVADVPAQSMIGRITNALRAAAEQARAEEREACLQEVGYVALLNIHEEWKDPDEFRRDALAAIRARGTKP